MIDGDRTIAGFVFSVPSRHGKINELLKQLCNQFKNDPTTILPSLNVHCNDKIFNNKL
jgi:hypothetical protein